MPDDRRLVRRIQSGERRAFEEFVDSFGPRVHRLVSRYVENPTDAEDLTQEIFIDIFRGIGKFRGESALSTWVYRVAVNHCLRYRQRRRLEVAPCDEEAIEAMEDLRAGPELAAARGELTVQVRAALDGLSPLHRDVVILHELHGLTYQECADVLEVPVGTVKSRLSNAFRRLRSSLAGYVLGDAGSIQPDPLGETN